MLHRFSHLVFLAMTALVFGRVMVAQISALEGDVKGQDGTPVSGAVIRIDRMDISGLYQTKTDKNGHFFYNGLPLGRYRVTCNVDGQDVGIVEVRTEVGDPVVVFDLRATPSKEEKAQNSRNQSLDLGSVYVNAQNAADRLQLNGDHSFLLQEGGQLFSGSYSVAGSTLKLHIAQLQRDVDILIRGDELVVNGEETWTQSNKVSESPVAAPSTTATGLDRHLADLENDIEAGKEVRFPIKYASTGPGVRRTNAFYSPNGGLVMYMADGVLTLSRTTFGFSGQCLINRGFGRAEHCDFRVSPSNILELENQPEQSFRLHVKVAIKNTKGDKEDKKDYYFYNVGAQEVGDGTVGGPGTSIICSGCDDSMNTAYAVLTWIRALPATDRTPAVVKPSDFPLRKSEFYWRQTTPREKPPFGDYILLDEKGGFQLVDVKVSKHYFGTYTVDDSAISFTGSAPPLSKHLLSNPRGSNRVEPGKIIEPDGTVWQRK